MSNADPAICFASPRLRAALVILLFGVFVCSGAGCRRESQRRQGVRPRTLRDVPSSRLAYQFSADTDPPPGAGASDDANPIVKSVQTDFDTRRPEDALHRTVISPDGQRILVVYATGEDQPNEFRIDIYGAGGDFQRHVTPAGLAVVFPTVTSWSPDGNFIAFIAYKSSTPQPTPTPLEEVMPDAMPAIPNLSPSPLPSPRSTVPLFTTEQIYICNRDGFDLKPLTTRAGLIYFYISWAPDSHALVSLGCRENEWRDRPLQPAGRPRLIGLNGGEQLLDDTLTDVLPVWSPDASKVATAVDTDVRIYDALTDTPSQAGIPLKEPLLAASRPYDAMVAAKQNKQGDQPANTASQSSAPISFNPIVTLEWTKPETLYLQTGHVRNFDNGQVREWMRWHMLRLSAQAALLN